MERFKLMNGDLVLGIVTKDGSHFSFERNTEIVKPWLFPYEFYELKSENLPNEVTSEQIESFFRDRGIPEDRQCIEIILDRVGIPEYDYWELNKWFHGRDIDDNFHIEEVNT